MSDSRIELHLRRILGESVQVPEPMSRVEELLSQIVTLSSGSESGTVGTATSVILIDSVTSVKYQLNVINGKLTMSEVE